MNKVVQAGVLKYVRFHRFHAVDDRIYGDRRSHTHSAITCEVVALQIKCHDHSDNQLLAYAFLFIVWWAQLSNLSSWRYVGDNKPIPFSLRGGTNKTQYEGVMFHLSFERNQTAVDMFRPRGLARTLHLLIDRFP